MLRQILAPWLPDMDILIHNYIGNIEDGIYSHVNGETYSEA